MLDEFFASPDTRRSSLATNLGKHEKREELQEKLSNFIEFELFLFVTIPVLRLPRKYRTFSP